MNDDLISRAAATTIPILPKEHRKYQTMNIDDAYDLGWLDCQNCIEKLPPAQHRDNDYSYMGDPWEYFANTKDGDLSETEKQIKFIMWAGYAKGKKVMRETQPEPQWIPISEGLPNGREEVIVSCHDDSGDTPFDYSTSGWVTTDGEYWITDNDINNFVTAWMPLPKPYKENKNIVIKKLKPCPFCGGTVKLQRCDHGEGDVTYAITCFNCYVDMGEYKTVEEIREVWNKRVES